MQNIDKNTAMEISNPFGVGLITHVKPNKALKLSELFEEVKFNNFHFLLEIGSIYVDGKRVFENVLVPEGAMVRIHRNPKRHSVSHIDWPSLIIENNEDFVVINKPYGVPVHPTVDNSRENVLYHLSEVLNEKLLITHRLDSETTGLMLYAKNSKFQNIFNYLIANRMVEKKYKALTKEKPELGHHLHYLKPDKFLPKLATKDFIDGWISAELVIENIKNVALPNNQPGYENTIHLITGRTHQIRAQLTALNCPLFADVLYGDEENSQYPLGLKAYMLSFKWPARNKEFKFEI